MNQGDLTTTWLAYLYESRHKTNSFVIVVPLSVSICLCHWRRGNGMVKLTDIDNAGTYHSMAHDHKA